MVLRTTVLHTTALLRRLYIKASCRASCRVSCNAFVRVNFLDICVNAKPSYEYRRYVSDTRPYRIRKYRRYVSGVSSIDRKTVLCDDVGARAR